MKTEQEKLKIIMDQGASDKPKMEAPITNEKRSFFKEKLASISSSVSGTLSFLGGYQVCHNLCMGIIALLSLIGITVVGMPLLFLQKVAIPFWIAAVVLFAVTLGMYVWMRCLSKNLLLMNFGILLVSMPFQQVKLVLPLLWIGGGALVLISVLLMVKGRIKKARESKAKIY